MSRASRLLATAVSAVVLLGAVAVGAPAFTFELSPAGSIQASSNGPITFGSGVQVACDVTFDGTLAPRLEAVEGAHLGSITRVSVTRCSGGAVEGVYNLPWSLELHSIEGTMPNEVTGIAANIEDVGITISTFGGLVRCSYTRLWKIIVVPIFIRPYLIPVIFYTSGLDAQFDRGSALCPRSLSAAGEFALTPNQTLAVS